MGGREDTQRCGLQQKVIGIGPSFPSLLLLLLLVLVHLLQLRQVLQLGVEELPLLFFIHQLRCIAAYGLHTSQKETRQCWMLDVGCRVPVSM